MDASDDAKKEALNQAAVIAQNMEQENNVENLIKAKGFADCVAFIQNGECSVVVASEGLLDSEAITIKAVSYTHLQHEIRQGFVTMASGHRVGVCGTAVYEENRVSGIRDISSLNIRIAREVYGAADELLRELDKEISGLLIAGPPSSGKSTILRDLARQLSICLLYTSRCV